MATLALLAMLPRAEARRPRAPKAPPPSKAQASDGEAPERRSGRGARGRAPAAEAQAAAPAPCDDAGCEAGLLILVEEDGAPPRPVGALRYRLRLGDQRVEGACPRARDEGPEVARCRPGGLLLPYTPEAIDVAVEAPGLRPLLQTLRPQYEARGCCQRAELHLALRRESGRGPDPTPAPGSEPRASSPAAPPR